MIIQEKLKQNLYDERDNCVDHLLNIDFDQCDAIHFAKYWQTRWNALDDVLQMIRKLEKYGDE